MWNYERRTTPFKRGGRFHYFQRNSGLQSQSVLYVQNSLAEEPRVLIDPNTWSKDGTVALNGTAFSEDGRYVAYGVAEAGSDWITWKVMEIESGKTLPDELKWVKFSGTVWTKDGAASSTRVIPSRRGCKFQSLNKNMKVYYHRAGTAQSEDVLVYERPDQPDWGSAPISPKTGSTCSLYITVGTDSRNQLLYRKLDSRTRDSRRWSEPSTTSTSSSATEVRFST
jgi:prolyl oligopeptidase